MLNRNEEITKHLNLGIRCYQQGEYLLALQEFSQIIVKDPTYHVALCNRGAVFSQFGQYEKAIVDFKSCLAIKPDYCPALSNLSSAYFKVGNFEQALVYNTKIIVLNTNPLLSATLYSVRGEILTELAKKYCSPPKPAVIYAEDSDDEIVEPNWHLDSTPSQTGLFKSTIHSEKATSNVEQNQNSKLKI